jgi:hypothetical protein
MDIIRTILATLFVLMGLGIAMQAWHVRRLGLLLGAIVYAGAGVLAFKLAAWWPLFAGFGGAWALRYTGADPPTDLRLDLPTLDRLDVSDADQVDEYLTKWAAADSQVACVASRFVSEAWERGYRRPSHIQDAPEWSETTAVAGWRRMLAADLQRVASADKSVTIRYLDQLDQLSTPTLLAAGEATIRYGLPATPSTFAEVQSKISDPQELEKYACVYVADALLAGRLRVLAWTFQQWFGERYELPHKRGVSI